MWHSYKRIAARASSCRLYEVVLSAHLSLTLVAGTYMHPTPLSRQANIYCSDMCKCVDCKNYEVKLCC